MICDLCLENRALYTVTTIHHGEAHICRECLCALIDEALDEREQADRSFCAPCCHYHGDGGCDLNLTPRECC